MAKPAVWLDDKRFLPFSFYALLIAVLGALLVEGIKGEWEKHPNVFYWTLALLFLVSVMGLYYHRDLRKWLATSAPQPLSLRESSPPPLRGLVVLVSRGLGVSSAKSAIDHHHSRLEFLWLIHSSDQGSLDGCAQLEGYLLAKAPRAVAIRHLLVDVANVEIALKLVQLIQHEAKAKGISPHDFICDFTGMPKPPGAGMVLACLAPQYRLQYMRPTHTNPDGSPDPNAPSIPVEVHLRYEDLEPAESD